MSGAEESVGGMGKQRGAEEDHKGVEKGGDDER